MARIGILTCSNATQDLGCSSASCLADLRKRRGQFADYPADEPLDLVGVINCPGCPTLTGPEKLLQRIRGLTEFRVDVIHFTYCMKALCPFREKYREAIEKTFPCIRVVIGTHEEHITPEEYRDKVRKLFCQERKSMVDIILKRD
ncbi:MAG: CGGC domain-containing protein [Nitrospirota bacterium]|nr:CGGC domain-containing protein [Nitrospirota bacterium]